jgi:hypothetical protein
LRAIDKAEVNRAADQGRHHEHDRRGQQKDVTAPVAGQLTQERLCLRHNDGGLVSARDGQF